MRKLFWIGGAAAVLAVAAAVAGGTAAMATSNGDSDVPLTGSDLEKATQAALAHTGGGTVTETEVGDDGAAYGVEIRKPDGRHVEVNLDSGFVVTGEEADDDSGTDDG